MKKLTWGILGPGTIANNFVQGLKSLDGAAVGAVGAYPPLRADAEAFASKYGIPVVHGSYDELISDPGIDIIYISTINSAHKEYAMKALRAKKAVLCEKPMTVNAKDGAEVVACAKENNCFLMEGLWYKFLPVHVKLRELLSAGVIGEVKMVKADFDFHRPFDPKNRLYDIAKGGGSLLDVGIYGISFASMVYGKEPGCFTHLPSIGETGVDEQCAALLKYSEDELAVVTSGIRLKMPRDAYVFGRKGYIHIPSFWNGTTLNLYVDGCEPQLFELPYTATGYNCEAAEVMRCVREGRIESPVHSHGMILSTLKIMDKMRSDWGLAYPFEQTSKGE
ncbi:MAG: Gfo/Idh/MocA family protein [Christensenellales bacterium]